MKLTWELLYTMLPPQPSPSNNGTFNCGCWEYQLEASGSVSSHRKEPCQNLYHLRRGRLQSIASLLLVRWHNTASPGWNDLERSTQPLAQRQTGCPTPQICLPLFACPSPYSSPKKRNFLLKLSSSEDAARKPVSGTALASHTNFQTKWAYQPNGGCSFVVTSLLLISGK